MFMFICRLSQKKKVISNSSLPSLSTTLFFLIAQITGQQRHRGMKLGTQVY